MKLNNVKKKQMVISLIKDDLTNIRLVYGLENLGLDSGKYYLNLCNTIFELLEITDEKDHILEEYLKLAERAAVPEIFGCPERLEELAQTIYHMLVSTKNER